MRIKKLIMTTAMSLGLFAGAANAAELSNAHIGRTIGVTCMGCHGFMGVSKGTAPSLKGLPASVTSSQLKAFKSGARPSTIMGRIAKGYSESDMDAVANYFANLK